MGARFAWGVRARRKAETGAAAVEFALVSPLMLVLVLGIMQYGLFFNDSLQVRQGVREGARLGVAQGDPGGSCHDSDYAQKVACFAASQISPVTGDSAVRVVAPNGWAQGNPLLVCAVVDSAADNIGLVPVPGSGMVRSKTRMSIEMNARPTAFTSGSTYFSDESGSLRGETWSWCS